MSILRLYANVTYAKDQEKLMHWFFKKHAKPHVGPILASFGPKTSKQDFSQKKSSSQFYYCNVIQKMRNILSAEFL